MALELVPGRVMVRSGEIATLSRSGRGHGCWFDARLGPYNIQVKPNFKVFFVICDLTL